MANPSPVSPRESQGYREDSAQVDRNDFAIHKHRKTTSTGGGRAWTEEEVYISILRLQSTVLTSLRNRIFSALVSTRCRTSTLPTISIKQSWLAASIITRCRTEVIDASELVLSLRLAARTPSPHCPPCVNRRRSIRPTPTCLQWLRHPRAQSPPQSSQPHIRPAPRLANTELMSRSFPGQLLAPIVICKDRLWICPRPFVSTQPSPCHLTCNVTSQLTSTLAAFAHYILLTAMPSGCRLLPNTRTSLKSPPPSLKVHSLLQIVRLLSDVAPPHLPQDQARRHCPLPPSVHPSWLHLS